MSNQFKDNRPEKAGGWGSILYSLKMSRRAGGVIPMLKALLSKNACKTCALGMGGQSGGLINEKGKFPEVCNKSFQAQASDMQGILPPGFFERHTVEELCKWTPRQLELSGRLTRPVLYEEGSDRYREIDWQTALDTVVDKMKSVSPDRSYFYASGRSSNEAAFLLQIFARFFGTNNVNNCSYYCHQASGVGLGDSLGSGTATIKLEDLEECDLMFLIGANPSSNHPRFMRTLMEIRRRGGHVIVINTARERGLENFSVPSDVRSLLFGSEISSQYIQPNFGADLPLLKGIAKALMALAERDPKILSKDFVDSSTEGFDDFKKDLDKTSWDEITGSSGVNRQEIEEIAERYAKSKNAVFAWAMGITHHVTGVENVRSIVNLALLRGMVGRKNAGLLPLRGHSNVQGVGSVGVTPQLKQTVLENLESTYGKKLPGSNGMDTLACLESAANGDIDFAWHLGGNLFGANPDSTYAEQAFSKIGFTLYMNTTLNPGHFRGRGKTSLILPVLARDEEPQKTTQESMFSFVRMSDGGKERYVGPRSETEIIAEIADKTLSEDSISWAEFKNHANIRKAISMAIPGLGDLGKIDETREEFFIPGRALHENKFPTPNGKAKFSVCSLPKSINKSDNEFMLSTIRSEGQFNTVVYDSFDRYRGAKTRDIIFMNPEDIEKLGFSEGEKVLAKNTTGEMEGRVQAFPVKPGNIMMYYPEANILVPRTCDEKSRTPAFKSISVEITQRN
jgi:molybdopterin-dependent oxidoreductase alpha subunit